MCADEVEESTSVCCLVGRIRLTKFSTPRTFLNATPGRSGSGLGDLLKPLSPYVLAHRQQASAHPCLTIIGIGWIMPCDPAKMQESENVCTYAVYEAVDRRFIQSI